MTPEAAARAIAADFGPDVTQALDRLIAAGAAPQRFDLALAVAIASLILSAAQVAIAVVAELRKPTPTIEIERQVIVNLTIPSAVDPATLERIVRAAVAKALPPDGR